MTAAHLEESIPVLSTSHAPSRSRPPVLASVATALPAHAVPQPATRAIAARMFEEALDPDDRRLLAVFESSGIDTRHFCMPLEWYAEERTFGEMNARYVEHALALAEQVAARALERAHLTAADVDHVVFVSSTGLATPSLDARLANRLPLRSDVRRTPIWGLGCAGGASGLARARDFALADPGARVLLIALELCSLTFQRRDLDRRNLVAAALFADGAAAAVIAGAEADLGGKGSNGGSPALELVASRSMLWPDTLDVMGWDVDEKGLHVIFSRDIPTIVRDWVRPNLDSFLAANGTSLEQIGHVVAHPGGPKVLAAYAEALGLPRSAFRHAEGVLRACGNMSSPTCLFVLERTLAAGDIRPGDAAVLAALGPGFSSELVLMRGGTA
ncbi:MAG TPA: 3-oxoacyl-[acyl-carrier-protein] synthase III C-terminal domain-containing protein [Candidatus Eisenbacteria bacterium]|jgi:alkylresorcinol/alkylpyrone synthase